MLTNLRFLSTANEIMGPEQVLMMLPAAAYQLSLSPHLQQARSPLWSTDGAFHILTHSNINKQRHYLIVVKDTCLIKAITQTSSTLSPVGLQSLTTSFFHFPNSQAESLVPSGDQIVVLSFQTLTFQCKHLQFMVSVPFLHKTHSTKHICIKKGIMME